MKRSDMIFWNTVSFALPYIYHRPSFGVNIALSSFTDVYLVAVAYRCITQAVDAKGGGRIYTTSQNIRDKFKKMSDQRLSIPDINSWFL